MTTSTPEVVTPLDLGEGSNDLFPKSFAPVDDTFMFIKQIDWADVRQRCRGGVNNIGIALAVIGEKIHDAGVFLAQV